MNYSDFDSHTGLGNTRLMHARFAQCAGEQTEFGIILIDDDLVRSDCERVDYVGIS